MPKPMTNTDQNTSADDGKNTELEVTGSTAATPAAPPSSEERTFTQADLDRIIRERLADEKRRADEKAKLKAGEFEQVANERATRITQLEEENKTTKEQYDALVRLIDAENKERIKALPAEMRDLVPMGDVLAQREWLTKAEKAAAKLSSTQPTSPVSTPGTPSGPRGTGAASANTSINDVIAQKRRSGHYGEM